VGVLEPRAESDCSPLATFIFSVRDTSPDEPPPAQWPAIMSLWLRGMSTSAMAREDSVSSFTTSPSELSLLIEDPADTACRGD